jgi:hypothetical protein
MVVLCVQSSCSIVSLSRHPRWQKNVAKGTSIVSLLIKGSLSLKTVSKMIRAAFLTIVSWWLYSLQVTASSGKLLVLELVNNLTVSASIYRARLLRKETNVSTNSSS